ncbi:MAG: Na+/H+ antiporter NhaA [Bryobacteraceae bacterium]
MPSPPSTSVPISRLIEPFQRFAEKEASGGLLLLLCTAAALVWANSPWRDSYSSLWHTKAMIGIGTFTLSGDLHFWVNDLLMAVFFFVVGLEIKREMLVGELASIKQAALPVLAALGGVVVPAILFSLFNLRGPGAPGWGIPMATDIAFALGVMALLGPRIPLALKVFLTALAIADDLAAVLVIALFYAASISWGWLAVVLLCWLILWSMNRMGVLHPLPYIVLGILLWIAVLQSGIHATITGVLLAFTIPAGPVGASEGDSPLHHIEQTLTPWVAFLIMPIFAFANAGVTLPADLPSLFSHPLTLGVIFGLLLGKPLGISLASWLAVRTGLAALPSGVTWSHIHGTGWLAGIGFTMSLFIAGLAFADPALLNMAKVGILVASLFAGAIGAILLRRVPLVPPTPREIVE